MNDQATQPPVAKPPRKRTKSTTPRAARTIDPGVAELRKQHNEAVAALRDKRRSAVVLKTILYKRLAQLTIADKETLADYLSRVVTPALIQPEEKFAAK